MLGINDGILDAISSLEYIYNRGFGNKTVKNKSKWEQRLFFCSKLTVAESYGIKCYKCVAVCKNSVYSLQSVLQIYIIFRQDQKMSSVSRAAILLK